MLCLEPAVHAARREIHTGRMNFLHRSWSPLEPFDDSMPELLRLNGIYTHLVTDHYHYFENGGATYHTRYNTWEFVRGQEGDPWKGEVKDPDIPPTVGGRTNCLWRQDWVNRKYMEGEENHPQTMTFDKGLEFIQTNHQNSWFPNRGIDPHEPFSRKSTATCIRWLTHLTGRIMCEGEEPHSSSRQKDTGL